MTRTIALFDGIDAESLAFEFVPKIPYEEVDITRNNAVNGLNFVDSLYRNLHPGLYISYQNVTNVEYDVIHPRGSILSPLPKLS